MNLLLFLLIGLVAGWLAGKLMRGQGFGLLGNVAVGILGAFLGGLLFGAVGATPEASLLGQLVSATVGAVLLLFVVDQVRGPA
jgi:uncharacterized membrane protein YeaQ/YmgE (transglycosylase-associated protein family)